MVTQLIQRVTDKLIKLKGLGEKSIEHLNKIGIFTRSDLLKTGPVQAYLQLQQLNTVKPSLNFLYAMVGALEDRHWADIAREDKQRLLSELDGFNELKSIFEDKI